MAEPKKKRLSAAAKKAKPKNRYAVGGPLDEETLAKQLGRSAGQAVTNVESSIAANAAKSQAGIDRIQQRESAAGQRIAGAIQKPFREAAAGYAAARPYVSPGGPAQRGAVQDGGPRPDFTPVAPDRVASAQPAVDTASRPAPRIPANAQPMADWQRNYETGGAPAPAAAVARMGVPDAGIGGPEAAGRYQRAAQIYQSMGGDGAGGENPRDYLFQKAKELFEAGQNYDPANFDDRMRAAIQRKQANNLFKAATDEFGVQEGTRRAQMSEQGATERTRMSESAANQRKVAELEAAVAAATTKSERDRALKQLESELKMQEETYKETLPSQQALTGQRITATGLNEANAVKAQQLAALQEEVISGDPATRSRAVADLAAIASKANPQAAQEIKTYEAILKDPIMASKYKPEELETIAALLLKLSGGQGYADGGQVTAGINRAAPVPMAPAAPTMGMPNIQPQVQLVNDYRAYAAAAARLGATPVPFDQFSSMKMARQAQGFAMGGAVVPVQDAAQQPVNMGFKDGGAIPVAGKHVLGPGTGKSDSIPAIIDGKTPAALSTGEFVMPIEAVRFYGVDRLNKMVEKARVPSSE